MTGRLAMLAPDARAVLLDQLRPPVGYRLDAAVATTFTLDLTAALVPPLAFASFELRGTPDPVAALEAVRSCTDRVDVFYQAGQLAIPAQHSDLMAYLEPMVHAVHRPRAGHLFHPKIWLLRYVADAESDSYRLLCLTRNLTQDHSWDAVLRLDGLRQGRPRAANRPLAELVRALPNIAVAPLDPVRRERVTALAEDVRHVEWTAPEDVKEVNFHVFGIRGLRPTADFTGYRHLVISPFLADRGLDTVAPGYNDVTVVSRPEDLDRLATETAGRITSYVVSSVAGVDDQAKTEETEQQVLTGLHAKVYVVERGRNAHVFLGSANATDAAFGGNVEILVEMVGGASKLGVSTFLAADAPFRALLEDYSAGAGATPDPADEARRALEDLLRDLASLDHTVTVGGPAQDRYTLTARTHEPLPIPEGYRVGIELLTRPGDSLPVTGAVPLDATWAGVPLADITPFLAVRAVSPEGLRLGTVIRAELIGDPAGRLDEVLARQIDTPEKFLRFLQLLLGLGNPHLLAMLAGSDTAASDGAWRTDGPGVFELALRALAERPDSITDLDRLVRRLRSTERGRAVLPEGFDALWTTVTGAHAQLATAAS